MCVCVCICFQVLTQLGGCTNSNRKERKGSGGGYEASIRLTRLGGLEMKRLQIADSSVDRCQDEDASMGFHVCILRYVFGMPVSLF